MLGRTLVCTCVHTAYRTYHVIHVYTWYVCTPYVYISDAFSRLSTVGPSLARDAHLSFLALARVKSGHRIVRGDA